MALADINIVKDDPVTTALNYVAQFYPLWFTYYQSQFASTNRLVGPNRISPLYQIVVAINNDTLYASTFLDLSFGPIVLTIPTTSATYSVLTLNPYGDIFASGIQAGTPGTYMLYGPGYTGSVPTGLTPIAIPVTYGTLIFRADKFSKDGQDETSTAEAFREQLHTTPLCTYLGQTCPDGTPPGGQAAIVPEIVFAAPFKVAADTLITQAPITFLKLLQAAVLSSHTPPMTAAVQTLSNAFNREFQAGNVEGALREKFSAGARLAFAAIKKTYISHIGSTHWVTFSNIGNWGDRIFERSAITEYLQFGNSHSTAAYFHAFSDGDGTPLDGSGSSAYLLKFAKDQIPTAKRFWSVTAYTPEAIELIPNAADKYEVASYNSGLQYGSDGSLSIYVSQKRPPGVAEANWLPVGNRPFNLMLRVYGPQGTVLANDYLPPAIVKIR